MIDFERHIPNDRHNNVSDASDAEFGGEFIMGGTNGALYTGDIDYVGLSYPSNPTFWAIPIQRKFDFSITCGSLLLDLLGLSMILYPME